MAKQPAETPQPDASDDGEIPMMQKLLDNHFLLLFLGVAVPTLLYIVWGVVEVAQIPIAD